MPARAGRRLLRPPALGDGLPVAVSGAPDGGGPVGVGLVVLGFRSVAPGAAVRLGHHPEPHSPRSVPFREAA